MVFLFQNIVAKENVPSGLPEDVEMSTGIRILCMQQQQMPLRTTETHPF